MIIEEGRLELRWFDPRRDTEQVLGLHHACMPAERWTEADLRKFLAHPRRNNVVKVLVDDRGTVYGSILYTFSESECRIRRLAVWPDYRRKGLATFMINSLTGARSPIRDKAVTARVGEQNVPAQLLFRHMRFRFDHTLPREKDENGKDYYLFTFVKSEVRELLACKGR